MTDRKDSLARARGLGSAKTGTTHWLMMQITTAAIIPLSLYLLASFVLNVVFYVDAIAATGEGLRGALAWLENPLVGIPMIVLIPIFIFNSFDYVIEGLLEDYVHHPVFNVLGIAVAKFTGVALAVTGVASVLKIMVGA